MLQTGRTRGGIIVFGFLLLEMSFHSKSAGGKNGPFVMSSIHGSAGGTCSHAVDISVADGIKQLSTCVAEFQQDGEKLFNFFAVSVLPVVLEPGSLW